MSQQPAVVIKGLQKRYGDVQAVKDVSLQIEPGEIFGLLGPNGAGKTTTIRMLMGIIAAESGEIELFGQTSRRTTLKQKRKIGYVSQEQVFYPWMNALQLGKFVGGLYPDWDNHEFLRLLKVLEIPERRKSSQLSGGMRVKLALALALAPRPELLILDEPTAGLDPVARREFLDIIQHQAREYQRTTLFSSHLLDEVERAADTVGIIHRGSMRFEGELSELQQRVRQIELPDGSELAEGFEVWKDLEPEEGSGYHRLIVSADPEVWQQSELRSESLSLDDIFIACVGVEAAMI